MYYITHKSVSYITVIVYYKNIDCGRGNIPNVECFGVDVARGEAEGNIHPEAFDIRYVLEAAVNIFYIIS